MGDFKFQNRRDFLRYALGTATAVSCASFESYSQLLPKNDFTNLTILYTNDQHSRIEPFPANDPKYPNLGGFAKRATLIEQIRKEESHVLLLDAGDIFQGTSYFNYFKGELEYKLMSLMGYDAVTFGNHDFDIGCENILHQMPHAKFDFISCNYDFKNTALANCSKIFPYKIYRKGPLKIGICGVGIELRNLVDASYVKDIVYNDPIESVNKVAAILKEEENCDYIICLSHLGYTYESKKVSDKILAAQTKNIDLIIGGHTHTFLDELQTVINKDNREVKITQVGWAGIWLGRVDILFSLNNKKMTQNNNNFRI